MILKFDELQNRHTSGRPVRPLPTGRRRFRFASADRGSAAGVRSAGRS